MDHGSKSFELAWMAPSPISVIGHTTQITREYAKSNILPLKTTELVSPMALASDPSLASSLYAHVKNDIISGLWAPGRKITIAALRDHYKMGATPLREALNRLTAEGWVNYLEQRGFMVASVSEAELKELTQTRIDVEALAIKKSIARKSVEWEEKVVLALHTLSKTPRSRSTVQFVENPEWEKFHRAFHMTLIENCGSRWLVTFCAQLYDQLYRYRRLAKTHYRRASTLTEHKIIVDAIVGAKDASNALQAHYTKTSRIVLEANATSASAKAARSKPGQSIRKIKQT